MVNIDWLAFSAHLIMSVDELKNGITLRAPAEGLLLVEVGPTNIYKHRLYLLTDAGEKILTILHTPHSKAIPLNAMLVEVANRYLYGQLEWVKGMIESLHDIEKITLSRVDICCDFSPSPRQMKIITGLEKNTIYVQGKREGVSFYDYKAAMEKGTVERVPRQLSWGSKNSNIKWKLYNKTLEIYSETKNEKGEQTRFCAKPWIENRWKVDGLNCDNVWRLEVSISSANKYKDNDVRLSFADVIMPEYQRALFYSMYNYRFVCRRNEGHKDKSNDERVFLLNEEQDRGRIREAEPVGSKESFAYISLIRSMVAQLADVHVQAVARIHEPILRALADVLVASNLFEYFKRTYEKDWVDWSRDYKVECTKLAGELYEKKPATYALI